MFVDDILLIRENLKEVNNRLDELVLEGKGLRISRNKTEDIEYDFGGRNQEVDVIRRPMAIISNDVENFKYLGSFVQKGGVFGIDVKHRIKCGRLKWREASGVLCDKKIPMRLKGTFYRV